MQTFTMESNRMTSNYIGRDVISNNAAVWQV